MYSMNLYDGLVCLDRLLLDVKVGGLDLRVDAALGLGAAVLVHQVLEPAGALATVCEPDLVVHLLRRVHIPCKDRRAQLIHTYIAVGRGGKKTKNTIQIYMHTYTYLKCTSVLTQPSEEKPTS